MEGKGGKRGGYVGWGFFFSLGVECPPPGSPPWRQASSGEKSVEPGPEKETSGIVITEGGEGREG